MSLISLVFYWVILPWSVFEVARWLFRWAQKKNQTVYLFYSVSIILGSIPFWFLIPRTPTPPIHLPFDIQHAGKKTEAEIRIKASAIYIFSLSFIYDTEIWGDRDRVKALVGDEKGIKQGVPTPFKLTFTRTKCPESGLFFDKCLGEALILEKTFENLRLRSWGANNFDKYIIDIPLEKGGYRVKIESLKNIPELAGTRMGLSIYSPKR
jgi:hypothetical protein